MSCVFYWLVSGTARESGDEGHPAAGPQFRRPTGSGLYGGRPASWLVYVLREAGYGRYYESRWLEQRVS